MRTSRGLSRARARLRRFSRPAAGPLAGRRRDSGRSTETMRRDARRRARPRNRSRPSTTSSASAAWREVYPCDNVDLLEFLPLVRHGRRAVERTTSGAGPTQPSGREFALVGLRTGTAFVEITDPESAVYLGTLPSTGNGDSTWRDIKTYQHYAYIVSDSTAAHGMQVFDLDATAQRRRAAGDLHRDGALRRHRQRPQHRHQRRDRLRLHRRRPSAGTARPVPAACTWSTSRHPVSAGLRRLLLRRRLHPRHAVRRLPGPDTEHAGDEICFSLERGHRHHHRRDQQGGAGADSPARTTPAAATPIRAGSPKTSATSCSTTSSTSRTSATTPTPTSGMSRQSRARRRSSATSPRRPPAIDHNLYVKGELRLPGELPQRPADPRARRPREAQLTQVGYFDIYPANNDGELQRRLERLSVLRERQHRRERHRAGALRPAPEPVHRAAPAPTALAATPNGDQRIDLDWSGSRDARATFQRSSARSVAAAEPSRRSPRGLTGASFAT